MKPHWLIAALIAGLAGIGNSSLQAEVSVGDEVPAFTLVGSDGKTYTAAQFKGKKAFVIAWFPKAFTGG